MQHGGGWRALISAVGFLCLPLFFVVTLVSALFGGGGEAEEVDGIFDPCAGAKKSGKFKVIVLAKFMKNRFNCFSELRSVNICCNCGC